MKRETNLCMERLCLVGVWLLREDVPVVATASGDHRLEHGLQQQYVAAGGGYLN